MAENTSDRPNILVLMTDQQRFDTIAAAGYPWMKTPNLDRLVHEGCLFTNAYTPNPICVPARHCFLTGTTERHHNIVDNSTKAATVDGLPALPRVLSDHGYATVAVGKMHFHPPRRHNGFLEMHLMEEIPRNRYEDAYAMWLREKGYPDVRLLHGSRPMLYHEPQQAVVPDKVHSSRFVGERTIEVIDRIGSRQPWFIHASWIAPHPPWNVPASLVHHYDDVELPQPVGRRKRPEWEPESCWFGDDNSPEQVRSIRAAYYASISAVDQAIGRILDHLDELGLTDKTLILFTSDHGEMLGDHGLYQKMQPYEPSSHVPMIVRYPKSFAAGSRDDRFVDLMDVMPTCLDAAGITPEQVAGGRPYDPAGSSLLRLDEPGGRDRTVQRSAMGWRGGRWVMLRDQRYKYVHYARNGIEHFYDLQVDPHEQRNLVGTSDLPQAAFDRLKRRCAAEEQRWGPEGSVADGQLFEEDLPPVTEPALRGKFPNWANSQMPTLGDGSADEEALLLARQMVQAVEHRGADVVARACPDPRWAQHFMQCLSERGVSEQVREQVADLLKLPMALARR